jgi:hypothetical protein
MFYVQACKSDTTHPNIIYKQLDYIYSFITISQLHPRAHIVLHIPYLVSITTVVVIICARQVQLTYWNILLYFGCCCAYNFFSLCLFVQSLFWCLMDLWKLLLAFSRLPLPLWFHLCSNSTDLGWKLFPLFVFHSRHFISHIWIFLPFVESFTISMRVCAYFVSNYNPLNSCPVIRSFAQLLRK